MVVAVVRGVRVRGDGVGGGQQRGALRGNGQEGVYRNQAKAARGRFVFFLTGRKEKGQEAHEKDGSTDKRSNEVTLLPFNDLLSASRSLGFFLDLFWAALRGFEHGAFVD